MKTDLSKYDNSWYKPGGNFLSRRLWFLINAWFLINPALPFSGLRVFWLKIFGAKIGRGVIIKPGVNVKYPWNLEVGDYTWIGERVWIDNLVRVKIGAHACLSQGAMLLTGNHNYKKSTFDLMVEEIELEDGVWIGAQALVSAGVKCGSHAVLAVNSVAVSDLKPWTIYQGNPAVEVRERKMEV
ncbi:MAG: colanic acid biosynthesis acetyltransferase WcaF [Bacteroidia bacterium]|nr:colanic acid biosynthesis acetyltransferase WcaF [Bacteroidia bacterium]